MGPDLFAVRKSYQVMLMLMVMLLVWRPRTTALKEEKKTIKEILPEGVTFFWWLHSIVQMFSVWMFLWKLSWVPVRHDSDIFLGSFALVPE